MSDFVDYSKRSITLPTGCKDLVDVLRRDGSNLEWLGKYLGIDLSRAIERDETVKGKFPDIEKRVRQAVTASALMFSLQITPADQRFTFMLRRLYQQPLQAIMELEARTPQEAALRRSLAAHKLRTPHDAIEPEMSFPDLPWRLALAIEPLPGDPLALSRLVSELLRETNGQSPEPGLAFHHYEIVMAA